MLSSLGYIQMIAKFRGDTIHKRLLKEGRQFTRWPLGKSTILRANFNPRRANGCYYNAQHVIMMAPDSMKYRYFEGYARGSKFPTLPPINHAWVVDCVGRVVECTPGWGDAFDYYGVEFSKEQIRKMWLEEEKAKAMLYLR